MSSQTDYDDASSSGAGNQLRAFFVATGDRQFFGGLIFVIFDADIDSSVQQVGDDVIGVV